MAILIPCLEKLFDEFDQIAPGRDHTTDGWIGDDSHSASVSDHNPDETGNVPTHDADSVNEVHAIDVDKDLRESFTMENVVQFLISECRKSSGTDRGRLKYIIYNRRIWKASNGWKQETYTGSNPHDKHAHYSAEYDTKYESDTSTWGLIERFGGGDVSEAEVTSALEKFFKREVTKTPDGTTTNITSQIGRDALDQFIPNGTRNNEKGSAWAVIKDLGTQLMALRADVTALAGKDFVNEQELSEMVISGVLAGLSAADGAAETIADAVVQALPEDMAEEVANLILRKQGQAMVDASNES